MYNEVECACAFVMECVGLVGAKGRMSLKSFAVLTFESGVGGMDGI